MGWRYLLLLLPLAVFLVYTSTFWDRPVVLQKIEVVADADAAMASTVSADESAADPAAQASLADGAAEGADSAVESAAQSTTDEPVAVEGDTLPVKQAQAEAVPAA